jgi:hypothetical protein
MQLQSSKHSCSMAPYWGSGPMSRSEAGEGGGGCIDRGDRR